MVVEGGGEGYAIGLRVVCGFSGLFEVWLYDGKNAELALRQIDGLVGRRCGFRVVIVGDKERASRDLL